SNGSNHKRDRDLSVEEMDLVSYPEMQSFKAGQAMMNALGRSERVNTFFMGNWLEKLNNQEFHINRFLQVHEPTEEDMLEYSQPLPTKKAKVMIEKGIDLVHILQGKKEVDPAPGRPVFTELSRAIGILDTEMSGIAPIERGAVLYL